MKPPVKCRQAYSKIKDAILDGSLLPDTPLPRETDFAGRLGVARGTLRQALALLENEGLVRRVRGHGTYVNAAAGAGIIVFLVPCPDFSVIGSGSMASLRQQIYGVMREAQKANLRVETLPVSSVNDPDRIDFLNLNHLQAGSLVVIPGIWFKNVFEFISRRRCRVCLDYDQSKEVEERLALVSDWMLIENDIRAAAQMGFAGLRARGCRSLLFFSYPEAENDYALRKSYFALCEEYGLKPEIFESDPYDFDVPRLAAYCRKKHIDGIITNFDWDIHDNTYDERPFDALGENMEFFAIAPPLRQTFFSEKFQGAVFERADIGSLAVRMLLNPDGFARKIVNPPVLFKSPRKIPGQNTQNLKRRD